MTGHPDPAAEREAPSQEAARTYPDGPEQSDAVQKRALSQPLFTEDADLSYLRRHVLALQSVLLRKGLITYAEVLDEIHRLEAVDHEPGARVVARAWVDPDFKRRLLENGKQAVAELGIQPGGYETLQVVENTDTVHHVVVCTTCSCSPSPLVGLNPDWYKSTAYRTRVVEEPRAVLREFGLELPEDVEVKVVDTDLQRRCLVLPQLPPGAEGLSEEQLATLVTRDSLFGVGLPAGPVGA